MSNENKTHYRKAFNSPYLSSADIVEPTTLTIQRVILEDDKSKKTKDSFNTCYFVEQEIRKGETLKPMILNAHNSNIVKSFANSPFIDDWGNIRIKVYVDKNVRFGRDTVEGLRIDPNPPQARQSLKPNTKAWENAKDAYKRDNNLDAVKQRMDVLPEIEQQLIGEVNEVS